MQDGIIRVHSTPTPASPRGRQQRRDTSCWIPYIRSRKHVGPYYVHTGRHAAHIDARCMFEPFSQHLCAASTWRIDLEGVHLHFNALLDQPAEFFVIVERQ